MKEKTYYSVKEITEQFRDEDPNALNTQDLLYYQVKAQVAIAQQLTIISSALGELLEAVHRSEKTASNR